MSNAGHRLNIAIGILVTGALSFFAMSLLLGEYHRPVFSPQNTWLWLTLMTWIPLGFIVALIGLRRRINCGYFIWSQLVLCFLAISIYIGWHRRELDIRMGPNPDEFIQPSPEATFLGFLFLLFLWLVIGFFPLAIRQLGHWLCERKAKKVVGAAIQVAEPGRAVAEAKR